MSNTFLAGDIGGTNARFALVSPDASGRPVLREARAYSTAGGVAQAAARFLAEVGSPQVAGGAFGIAGPVVDGACHMPNAGWTVSEAELKAQFGFGVRLHNDMVANAAGIAHLTPADFKTLHAGKERAGHRVLIAPGTGLGKAILPWDGAKHVICAGEGGHTDFGPRNPTEDALVVYLRGKFGRVSAERLACGQGLPNIYAFLKDTGRGQEPAWLRGELAAARDPGPVLFAAAFEKKEPIAQEVFRLFAGMLGSEAGNLSLLGMAVGGCYIGGGIIPRIGDWLVQSGHFLEAFRDKAPHGAVVEGIPVRLITNPQTALIGAAGLAMG